MVTAKRRFVWWLLPPLLVVMWLAWQVWQARDVAITLPLLNKTEEAVALEFYGPGLLQPARVDMAPMTRHSVDLMVTTHAALRIRVVTRQLQNDAVLLDDARVLQAASQQFEIRPGGEFVLVARD